MIFHLVSLRTELAQTIHEILKLDPTSSEITGRLEALFTTARDARINVFSGSLESKLVWVDIFMRLGAPVRERLLTLYFGQLLGEQNDPGPEFLDPRYISGFEHMIDADGVTRDGQPIIDFDRFLERAGWAEVKVKQGNIFGLGCLQTIFPQGPNDTYTPEQRRIIEYRILANRQRRIIRAGKLIEVVGLAPANVSPDGHYAVELVSTNQRPDPSLPLNFDKAGSKVATGQFARVLDLWEGKATPDFDFGEIVCAASLRISNEGRIAALAEDQCRVLIGSIRNLSGFPDITYDMREMIFPESLQMNSTGWVCALMRAVNNSMQTVSVKDPRSDFRTVYFDKVFIAAVDASSVRLHPSGRVMAALGLPDERKTVQWSSESQPCEKQLTITAYPESIRWDDDFFSVLNRPDKFANPSVLKVYDDILGEQVASVEFEGADRDEPVFILTNEAGMTVLVCSSDARTIHVLDQNNRPVREPLRSLDLIEFSSTRLSPGGKLAVLRLEQWENTALKRTMQVEVVSDEALEGWATVDAVNILVYSVKDTDAPKALQPIYLPYPVLAGSLEWKDDRYLICVDVRGDQYLVDTQTGTFELTGVRVIRI